ncbi:hypothetical protein POTOM_057477 [Populus tomentosa]|uniref:Phosphatidylinositol-specific phospholipase C X domain-containing protein n=1 Tax=Populus tomentosa TaxID=118781 RepID=A0A8X7XWI6_POPTO|nr:hypothetical protein POTOM_057477 [Populus tomentosa]
MIKRVRLFMRTIAVRRTLTNPVDLLVCLRAIKNNAFQASEYPVVITFEDHPPANLQAKVAEVRVKFCPGFIFIMNMILTLLFREQNLFVFRWSL